MTPGPKQPLIPQPGPLPRHAGRWVALVGNQVVGLGDSAAQAADAAKLNRPRETATVLYMPDMPFDGPIDWPDLIEQIRLHLPDPAAVWLVGGAVRDMLLHRDIADYDLVVARDAPQLARRLSNALPNARYYLLDEVRGTARVVVYLAQGGYVTIDVANLRAETLAFDLLDRDFTINALAISLDPDAPQFMDVCNGVNDLRERTLRLVRPEAVDNDPVRAVRAVRLLLQLGFKMDEATKVAVRNGAAKLRHVSAERVRDEFFKILAGPRPTTGVRVLMQLGLLPPIVPEIEALVGLAGNGPHVDSVWDHTLRVVEMLEAVLSVLRPIHDVDAASSYALGLVSARIGNFRHVLTERLVREPTFGRPARGLLLLAAVLHEIGKPATQTMTDDGEVLYPGHAERGAALASDRLNALKLSRLEMLMVHQMVKHHALPQQFATRAEPLTDREIHQFFRVIETAGPEVILLAVADRLALVGRSMSPEAQVAWANYINRMVELLDAYFLRYDAVVSPKPVVDGDDLQRDLGLTPGPILGELLAALKEEQAAGVVTDRESALDYARRWLGASMP